MDFGDELAYMIMSQLGISGYVTSAHINSLIAIALSFFMMSIAACIVNRYFPFLLRGVDIRINKSGIGFKKES
jgi:hypothetical protein